MLEAIYRDGFDRTTTSGLGTYGSTTYTAPTGDDNCHVNGSYVVSNVAFGFSHYEGMPRVVTGAVQFDFWVGSTSDSNVTYEVDGGWELQPSSGRYYHLLAKASCNGDGTFTISGYGRIIFSFAVTSNTWYRMRVEWDGTTERVKCWKVANPEPSTWGSTGTTTQFGGGSLTTTFTGTPKIEINGPSSSAREVRLDNIVIWDTFAATLAFSDDFNRTVGTGLGGNWAYTTDDSSQPAPGIMSVDGDAAHVAAGEFESQTNPDVPYSSQGYVRWDFLIPADIHDTPQMGFNFAAGSFYVGNPNGTSVWRAFRDGTLSAYIEFSPAASEWWTVWFWFGSGTDYVKVWPRDAPGEEPEWTVIPHTPGVPGIPNYGLFLIDVYEAPSAEDQLFDNLFVWASGPTTQTGSFTLASEIVRRSWNLDAIAKATERGLFDLEAVIAQGWRFDAWVRPAPSQFAMDAIVQSPISDSFPLSAEVATVAPVVFLLDATIGIRHPGSFPLKAWVIPVPFHTGSFDLAAFIIGSLGAFALDAQVSSPQAHADSFDLSAEVSVTYRQAVFSVAAVALAAQSGVFGLDAIAFAGTHQSGSFGLDARAAGRIALDAFVGYSFQLGAEIRNPAQEFDISAWIGNTGYGFFAFDAVIANGAFTMDAIVKAVRGDIIPFIASVIRRPSSSFGLDARVAGAFSLDAYVQPGFNLSAEITSGNDGQKYWPPGSGGPGNPGPVDGGTGQPWRPPHHQARIEILIDDVEVTKDVELAGCNFTQAAGNSPGTFSLPMKGVFTKYNGGEEVIVRIDGFRQFGGIVVAATHGFHYPYVAGENGDVDHPNEQPITILQGTDFNVLFDRVQIYNVPWVTAHGPSGDYEPIDPLPKDHSDRFYIQTIFAKYIDTVWRKQFGYNEYVEEATVHPSPETPFTVETGQTLRVFLSALSAVTNQIWYFDPYYELHSHSRANANAPRAITDGTGADSGGDPTGGIHCRDLTVVWSIEDMADDTFVFGTLAETTDGAIIFDRRRDPDNIAEFGLWQYMEVRSDLHLQEHVDQRGYALSVRSDRRIHRAQCRIYEKGFQAGQVVSLFSGEYGVAENIPIAQVTMTFAVSQGAEDGRYYGVPVYDLTMSNEPDPPWNLYDALPWQTKDFGPSPSLPGFGWRMPHLQLRNDGPGPQVAPCRDEDWQTIWADCGAIRISHPAQRMTLYTDPLSPPPWCVVFHMPVNNPSFSFQTVMLDTDDSPYFEKGSFGGGLAKIGPTWFVSVGSFGQNEDGGAGVGPNFQAAVEIDPTLETYARFKVLEDASVYARVWQAGSSEPTEWQAYDTYHPMPDFLPTFVVGMELSSRLRLDAHQLTELIVAGKPGSGFAWLDPLRTDEFATFRKIYTPYQPYTWGTIRYPAGTRPVVIEGDGGNVLDANSHPYLFPRDETWEIYPGTLMPLLQSDEHNLHRYVWDWAFVPGTGDGAPDEPRMLTDSHNYIGFIPPPGATRVTFKARVYVNVYVTGLFGVGEQPHPSGEGPIPFEVWVSDYRGQPADPDHNVIYSNVQPDYNYQGDIVWAYDVEWSQVVHADEMFQIGGKLTIDPQFLMNTHHEGPLLNNGLKRVLELKMTDISLRFEWDPMPCGDGVLGDCIDPNDDPYWETGWGQEMTAADKTTGAFTARLSVAPATLSVFAQGILLIPGTDYTDDGDADHRNYHLVAPGARCLRLVYLANTATVTTEPPQGGPGTGDRIPNRTTQSDIRGIGQ